MLFYFRYLSQNSSRTRAGAGDLGKWPSDHCRMSTCVQTFLGVGPSTCVRVCVYERGNFMNTHKILINLK